MLNRYLSISLLCGLIAAGSAFAQNTIGEADEVKGLVTMSDGNTVTSVADRTQLIEDARVVTSSTGYVTLKFDRGCEVKLEPNQSLVLRRDESCEKRLAAVRTLGSAGVFAFLPGGSAGPLIGLGIVAGGAASIVGAGGNIPNLPISGQ